MRVLSIDPGKTNFAYCVLEFDGDAAPTILEWNCVDITTTTDTRAIAKKFNDIFIDGEYDHVVVERQVSRNPGMVRMQHYIEMYFGLKEIPVHTVHPKRKLRGVSTAKSYRDRKRAAVRIAQRFVESGTNECAKTLFEDSRKKDDLADALLQGAAWFVDSKHGTRNYMPKEPLPVGVKPGPRRTRSFKPEHVVWYIGTTGTLEDVTAAVEALSPNAKKSFVTHFRSPTLYLSMM